MRDLFAEREITAVKLAIIVIEIMSLVIHCCFIKLMQLKLNPLDFEVRMAFSREAAVGN